MSDINRQVLERVERLEKHFQTYKTDVSDIKDNINEIKLLLGGSHLNGNKGFIRMMDQVAERVDALERKAIETNEAIQQVKFWGKTTTGLLVGFVLVLANYFKDLIHGK